MQFLSTLVSLEPAAPTNSRVNKPAPDLKATPGSPSSTTASSQQEKPKSEKVKKEKIPLEERYDFNRATGPDPRDGRTLRYACYGKHVEEKMGRGSASGCNGAGLWKVCSKCQLRILYVPAWGATGHYRQAGPLPKDVEVVTQQYKETVERGEEPDVATLKSKAVSLEGAGKGKTMSCTPVEFPSPTDPEQMSRTPGRKQARNQASEQLEYEEWEEQNWTRVDAPLE